MSSLFAFAVECITQQVNTAAPQQTAAMSAYLAAVVAKLLVAIILPCMLFHQLSGTGRERAYYWPIDVRVQLIVAVKYQ